MKKCVACGGDCSRCGRQQMPVPDANDRQKIRELLLKYTDPKPEFTGMNAWEIAGKIVDALSNDYIQQW